MLGYKTLDRDFKCRGYQYEVGKTYEMKEPPLMCERGFHFCKNPDNIQLFHNWFDDRTTRFAEIEALGHVVSDGKKSVTNVIRIIRELTREEFVNIIFQLILDQLS